ncbi:MAG TPA: O-antigen ligase family protein [Sphingobacteriaceae bacterium]
MSIEKANTARNPRIWNIAGEKLQSPLGIGFLLLVSISVAFLLSRFGVVAGAMVVLAVVAPVAVISIISYPKFGIVILLVSAYLIMWIIRMGIVDFPLGTLMDGLQALLLIGFLLKQKFRPDWKIYRNPTTILIIIWIAYNLLQVANPSAESRMAWLYTVRSVAVVMLMYFVFMYHITTIQFIRLILKLWLILTAFGALYGLKQEYLGFFAFEEAGLADPLQRALLFIGGHWRKFSIFSDPVAFSYNMVASTLLCIALITGPMPIKKKIVLGLLTGLFTFSMLFSGTRGAYVLIPAALVMLLFLKFNVKVFVFSAVAAIFLAGVVYMPTSNPALYRFQSAFKPSEDASFSVRVENQKRIKPYIQSHPFGGGLGATGVWGVRFAPNSYLANFPPDSGYVRVAVELGWIGLLIFCSLMFVVLRAGIMNFFAIRDPELKSYCLAMVLIVFALNIGNFPQEALVQFPTNIYFYLVIALINITYRLDQQKSGPMERIT